MILKGRTRNDVVFWFAREHGKHPNMVDAVLAAADYDSVQVVIALSGCKYKITYDSQPPGSESQEALYSIESV